MFELQEEKGISRSGIPAGVLVSSSCLGKRSPWIPNGSQITRERVLTREEIRDLASKLDILIGSHGVSRPRLTYLSESDIRVGLLQSKQQVENVTGVPVQLLSYPRGEYGARERLAALKSGYRWLFTIEPKVARVANGEAQIGRVQVDPSL